MTVLYLSIQVRDKLKSNNFLILSLEITLFACRREMNRVYQMLFSNKKKNNHCRCILYKQGGANKINYMLDLEFFCANNPCIC